MCNRVFFLVVTAIPKPTSGPAPKQEAIKVEDEVYILLQLIVKCDNYEGSINFTIYQIINKYCYYCEHIRYLLIIMPPFEAGRAYCFAAICLSLCWSVNQQFPFIYLIEVAHIEMKCGIQIYHNNI